MRYNMLRFLLGGAAICASVLSAHQSSAGTVYTINPALSSLSVAVSTGGVPLTLPQTLGSDTTSLSGTIDATVGGGNITFTDTNNIIFGDQPTPQKPGAGGGVPSPGTTGVLPDDPGEGTANYGLVLIVPSDVSDPLQWLNLLTSSLAGYADISGAISTLNGSSPIAGGIFSAATLNLGIFAGALDYNINANTNGDGLSGDPFLNGTTPIGGNSGVNSLAGAGSLVGNTLTIPVNLVVTVDTGLLVVDATFVGQIVATAVPEPSTYGMAAMSLVALVPFARRRLRKA